MNFQRIWGVSIVDGFRTRINVGNKVFDHFAERQKSLVKE